MRPEIEQSELDSARAEFLKQLDAPDAAASRLPSYARNLLTGHHNLTPDEHRAELAAVTLDDLREDARELHATALLQVPGRSPNPAARTAVLPAHPVVGYAGRTVCCADGPRPVDTDMAPHRRTGVLAPRRSEIP